ncbi:Gfo/Idh/MocA family oxidoreductase [Micromonospora sp. NPDC048170]|uniref:Gfo/Idh/MocA family protein n=1 Tax=Micromonospora sp. NPDC048170 TaxID=3154819 RepID=UPI0033EC28ED
MEKVVLVGAGGFGRCWWPGLTGSDDFEVVAVVEPDDRDREAAAAHFGLAPDRCLLPESGDWSTLGASMMIDSSPFPFHRANADRALAAGLDILVAKPVAPTAADATAMVEAAERAGRRIAVAQQMRYFPCFLALREVITAGVVGEPVAVTIRMALDGRGWTPGMQWRLAMAHPLLLEAGIHHLDLVRWCVGEITDVAAVSWNPPWSPFTNGDATVSAVLRTEGGVAVDYRGDFAPAAGHPAVRFDSGWDVVCTGGTVIVRDGGLFIDGEQYKDVSTTAEPVSLEELNAALLAAWVEAGGTGTEVPFSGRDNLRSMAALQAAIDSVVRR